LSADALLETEVVTAAGDVLTCNERENPDLFWACRGGGGGNFGINTRFRFRSWPVDHVTLYDLTWDWRDAPKVIAALQGVVREAPDEWSMRIGIGAGGKPGRVTPSVGTIGQFFGPKHELVAILDPVLSVAKPVKKLIARRTFWQAKTYLYDTTPAGYYAVKSNYALRPFSPEGIDVLTRAVERWPGSSNPDGGGIALFAWGGQVSRVPPGATAFVHRDPGFLMAYDTAWGPSDPPRVVSANLNWLGRLASDIAPHVSEQAYQNFIDRSLKDWKRAYYGANYDRLVRVKKMVDPDDFFHFEQSIAT
jgi:FAD/FMN-containing dehydrogenase